jgi:hypothetical protein
VLGLQVGDSACTHATVMLNLKVVAIVGSTADDGAGPRCTGPRVAWTDAVPRVLRGGSP